MSNTAASARAAGQLTGLRAGRSSGSRHRAVGTAGPIQGLPAHLEQRTPPSTAPEPQYLPRNYGPDGSAGWLCQSTLRQVDDSPSQPSESEQTRQFDALDFEPSLYTPINRHGAGRVAKDWPCVDFFFYDASVLMFRAEHSISIS